MTLYEDKEAAMVDYHGAIVRANDFPARGCLVINKLSSLMTDAVDITNDDNFHVVLKSQVHISSVEAMGNTLSWRP